MAVRYTAQSGRWTDPATWQDGVIPQTGDQVVIRTGHEVIYDVVEGSAYDVVLGSSSNTGAYDLDIYGTLKFDTSATQPLRLRFCGRVRVQAGGRFECGNASSPMPVKVTIQKVASFEPPFRGESSTATFCFVGAPNLPPDPTTPGEYQIVTYLAQDAASGSNQIVVQDNLNWQVGDRIVMPYSVGLLDGTPGSIGSVFRTVTAVNGNTLTLSSALPQNYKAGRTPVAKCGRLINIIVSAGTPSYLFDRTGQFTVERFEWVDVYFGDGGGGNESILSIDSNNHYWLSPLRYVSGYNAGAISACNFPSNYTGGRPQVYRCILATGFVKANAVEFRECVIYHGGRAASSLASCMPKLKSCWVFNLVITAAKGGGVYLEDCKVYCAFVGGHFAYTIFNNCDIYGLASLTNYANVNNIAHFINCRFYNAPDGTTAPYLAWGAYTNSKAIYRLTDCVFNEAWVEESGWASGSVDAYNPFLDIWYHNMVTSSGTVKEKRYREGGVIVSDDTFLPAELPNVTYSLKFTTRNPVSPLFYDIVLPPQGEVTVAFYHQSNASVAKIQVLNRGNDIHPLPLSVTPMQEINCLSYPAGQWNIVKVYNDSNEYRVLRMLFQGSASGASMWFAYQTPVLTFPDMFVGV